ncbi:MAG: GNAT family N-acetyltransferase [Verrucomicrobiota bacterium]
MKVELRWKASRLDEGEEVSPPAGDGLIEIDALILIDGTEAGTVDGFYLLARDPASHSAYFELWDMEQWICDIYGELMQPDRKGFREPLGRLLKPFPGILCIRHLALDPEFRGRGLGREVMRLFVAAWADAQVGAVILNSQPLQHRNGAYDLYDNEIRELPCDGPEEDGKRLAKHLRNWGFHLIAGTRWMAATPQGLGVEENDSGPPVLIQDATNTCVLCSGVIDLAAGEWQESDYGPVHDRCAESEENDLPF